MNMKKRNTTKKESTQNTITQNNTTNTPPEPPSTPAIFTNPEFGSVRVLTIDNEPWFVGKDVAEALEYADTKQAIRTNVSEEDKKHLPKSEFRGCESTTSKINNNGAIVINESGLYSLIISSKLPSAKRFKHWVTSEVLPTIRKTGGYVADENMFINTYLPFADEPTQLLFRTTLHTIQEQNTLIRTQQETIKQQKADLEYKQEMIQKFADQISVADMRQILNRVMRHNGGNFKNRWSLLYREFENKYKMNISLRLYNYNRNHTKKLKSKLDYIDFELHMIPELYELAVKLFESDVKELIEEMYAARR